MLCWLSSSRRENNLNTSPCSDTWKEMGAAKQVWKAWRACGLVLTPNLGAIFIIALCACSRSSKKLTELEETHTDLKLHQCCVHQGSVRNTVLLEEGLEQWEMALCCGVWLALHMSAWIFEIRSRAGINHDGKKCWCKFPSIFTSLFLNHIATAKQFIFVILRQKILDALII